MFEKLRNIAAGLLGSLAGRQPQAGNQIPSSGSQGRGDSVVAPILYELLQHHGVPTRKDDHWLVAENGIRITGAVVAEVPAPEGTSLQLDFYVELDDDRLLIESVGGIGATTSAALQDGIQNFTCGTFHVLLAAFFDVRVDGQVEVEEWTIAGQSRRVTIGGMNVRAFTDAPFDPPTHWFPIVQEAIQETDLPAGTHWFRCYYAQFNGQPVAVEVLLDNQDWSPIIDRMSDIEWPALSDFYSVRVFAVIQDDARHVVEPE